MQAWEYAVLVTNSAYPLDAFGQLYLERADCENGFDELRNQWGWGGFTTQDIERCQSSARTVALVYNWWSWYCRAARDKLMGLIANAHAALRHVKAVAEQLPGANCWKTFVDFVVAKITRPLPPWGLQNQLATSA